MDEKKPINNEWSDAERWFAELIQQTKNNAKHWFLAWLITLLALIATNAAWMYVFQSYEYISQDGTGVNSINTGNQEDVKIGTEDEG